MLVLRVDSSKYRVFQNGVLDLIGKFLTKLEMVFWFNWKNFAET